MKYFMRLWKGNKGISIVMLFFFVLLIGGLVTITYHIVERPQRIANAPKSLNELMRQLDKAVDSVKKKTKIESLSFQITAEAEAQDNDKLVLSGVLWSGEDSLAIINKKIVGFGDRVGDCWVSDVQENSVSLRCRSGGEKILKCY